MDLALMIIQKIRAANVILYVYGVRTMAKLQSIITIET